MAILTRDGEGHDFWLQGAQPGTANERPLDGSVCLAAYRRELLVDPGVHLRSVETAR
jgi:hypothetical protein